MTHYGAYRSAREAQDWPLAWDLASALSGDEREVALQDWWRSAPMRSVARHAQWVLPDPWPSLIWWGDHKDEPWALRLGGRYLACHGEFDLPAFGVTWAREPVDRISHFHRYWALVLDPAHADLAEDALGALRSGRRDPSLFPRVLESARRVISGPQDQLWTRAAWGSLDALRLLLESDRPASARQAVQVALLVIEEFSISDPAYWAMEWKVAVLEEIKRGVLSS